MEHLEGLARASPRLPRRGRLAVVTQLVAAVAVHVSAFAGLVLLLTHGVVMPAVSPPREPPAPPKISRLIFIARDPRPSGGGGGGGNRRNDPIRRAEGVGGDAITLRVAKPRRVQPRDSGDEVALPAVLLDARPLASGLRDLPGLPDGGVPFGMSLGPGSGGGVGEGAGSGIGAGIGPGLGPGSGGGTGGGIYRPGGTVTAPRLITQVKPKYTDEALSRKIQGTVVLQVVVRSDGRPGSIVVARSLDPGGLDDAAVAATRAWRFEPGRLAGTPVDVLVTVMLDFRIQ